MDDIEYESSFPVDEYVLPITSTEVSEKINRIADSLVLIDTIYDSDAVKSQLLNLQNIPQFFFSNSKMLAVAYYYINHYNGTNDIPSNFKNITYEWLSRVFKTTYIEDKYYIDLIKYVITIRPLIT